MLTKIAVIAAVLFGANAPTEPPLFSAVPEPEIALVAGHVETIITPEPIAQVVIAPAPRKISNDPVCNCYLWVKTLIPDLPWSGALVPNSKPEVGTVALFTYQVRHFAYVKELGPDYFIVSESNYKSCVQRDRKVFYTDKHLKGFWKKGDNVKAAEL